MVFIDSHTGKSKKSFNRNDTKIVSYVIGIIICSAISLYTTVTIMSQIHFGSSTNPTTSVLNSRGLRAFRYRSVKKDSNLLSKELSRVDEFHLDSNFTKDQALGIPSVKEFYDNPPKESFQECSSQVFDIQPMPNISIIIPSRNESWKNLWRTLESIFKRTPPQLLHEIILFDDCNKDDEKQATPIETLLISAKYHFPSKKLRILRTKKREGLIRLKNLGVHLSSAPVLVFLESHVEVQERWLEPLLKRIVESPNSIVLPQHDLLDEDTYKVTLLDGVFTGGLNCRLTFNWIQPKPVESHLLPKATPTMPGGLFAITRELWDYLGDYDDKAEVWGGENFDLSIRAWTCGARMEFIPCSHVAHEFHKKSLYSHSPTEMENILRVAAVWTSPNFRRKCNYFPEDILFTEERVLSTLDRFSIKKRLKCKSMDWFMENLYPDFNYTKFREKDSDKKYLYYWTKQNSEALKKRDQLLSTD